MDPTKKETERTPRSSKESSNDNVDVFHKVSSKTSTTSRIVRTSKEADLFGMAADDGFVSHSDEREETNFSSTFGAAAVSKDETTVHRETTLEDGGSFDRETSPSGEDKRPPEHRPPDGGPLSITDPPRCASPPLWLPDDMDDDLDSTDFFGFGAPSAPPLSRASGPGPEGIDLEGIDIDPEPIEPIAWHSPDDEEAPPVATTSSDEEAGMRSTTDAAAAPPRPPSPPPSSFFPPAVSTDRHDFRNDDFYSEDDVPGWMKEESDAVLALALRNYEVFHSLPPGSVGSSSDGDGAGFRAAARFLEGTSAGVAGWASCVLGAPVPSLPMTEGAAGKGCSPGGERRNDKHEEDNDGSRIKEGSQESTTTSSAPNEEEEGEEDTKKASAGAAAVTPGPPCRGDEEERRRLRVALLESVGARPPPPPGRTGGDDGNSDGGRKRSREEWNNEFCYSSSDAEDGDDADDDADEQCRGKEDAKRDPFPSTKKRTDHGGKKEETPDDIGARDAQTQGTKSGCEREGSLLTPTGKPREYENSNEKAGNEPRTNEPEEEDFVVVDESPPPPPPPKVSRSSWQWRNVVRHVRRRKSENDTPNKDKKRNDGTGKAGNEEEEREDGPPPPPPPQKRSDDDSSDGEWSLVGGAED